jgi:hypothetical protein
MLCPNEGMDSDRELIIEQDLKTVSINLAISVNDNQQV